MVIRGGTRGSGRQLANYLLTKAENENIWILDADGQDEMTKSDFSNLLFDMSVTAELTKSKKGLYHAQINPGIEESNLMTNEKWLEATDILAKELGMENQRRAIVLHQKKGRIHAHVVWERYNLEKGKMVSDSFSRLAQDRARMEMERILELQKTPRRSLHRPELKETLTKLWKEAGTGKEFIKAVDKAGYMLAQGTPRHPFMVVDENGRTYDLVRQLNGVRIKEVRERMKGEVLIPEKDAIEIMRNRNDTNGGEQGGKGSKSPKMLSTDNNADNFFNNLDDVVSNRREQLSDKQKLAKDFMHSRNDLIAPNDGLPDPKEKAAKFFSENRNRILQNIEPNKEGLDQLDRDAERERKKQEFKDAMKTKMEKRNLTNDREREPD